MIIDYLKTIAVSDNKKRRDNLKKILSSLQVKHRVDKFHIFFDTGENIIIDILNNPKSNKKILLTAHYDTFINSFGANDNGSAVAVLLHFIRQFKDTQQEKNLRFIFFDHEERYKIIGKDVNGSTFYLKKYGSENIEYLYNLEMVGIGNCLLLWPINNNVIKEPSFTKLLSSIKQEKIPYCLMNKSIPLFNSDHLPFYNIGFPRVCSLTAIYIEDIHYIEKINNGKGWQILYEYFKHWFTKNGNIPKVLKTYHNQEDTIEKVKEENLQKTFHILWNTVIN